MYAGEAAIVGAEVRPLVPWEASEALSSVALSSSGRGSLRLSKERAAEDRDRL